jgi:serine/threonine protein kinase
VENGSLNETMKKFGLFPEELLVLYIAQVLQGLKYLHDQNVIHRYVTKSTTITTHPRHHIMPCDLVVLIVIAFVCTRAEISRDAIFS